MHGRIINTRKFVIGSSPIEDLKEYTNLGIYKNYCGSFTTNVDENITKVRKKSGMLFSARFGRRRTNPFSFPGDLETSMYSMPTVWLRDMKPNTF